jgi:hypothetical protein
MSAELYTRKANVNPQSLPHYNYTEYIFTHVNLFLFRKKLKWFMHFFCSSLCTNLNASEFSVLPLEYWVAFTVLEDAGIE